jgi:hypothetical protein
MSKSRAFDFKKLLPYLASLAVLFSILIIYFYPVIEGKKLSASDMVHFKGMSKEIVDYREKTGEEALWTNNMFGGMPAYQISVDYDNNLIKSIHKILGLTSQFPIGMVFIYYLGFYILLLVLGVNPWLSIAGAIAFSFSSYFFIIFEAGHTSKAYAIGYMAPVLAGIILTYRGKYILGGVLTAFALALEIQSGHPQITYYLMLMVLLYGLAELIRHYREKQIPSFLKASAVLIAAALIAVLTHAASLWNTYEYSKVSIRGKTELSSEKENRTSGLDKDYATDWSYGIPETMTLLIPDFQGGSSHGSLSKNSETYDVLTKNRVPNTDQIIKALPLYWGPQPFTSGPVYVGAVIIFLFVFSLFSLKGPLKWWGIAVTVLSVLLAWGKHFMPLTNFFLDYFPLYNKFRAVAMTLIMAELSIPLLAILALNQVLNKPPVQNTHKHLKFSLYIVGGILIFFILFAGSIFTFSSASDAQSGLPDWLLTAIQADRLKLLRTDAIRSLIFILLTFGLLWAYAKGYVKLTYVLVLVPLLILADMWPVNKRFLNDDDFIRKSQVDNPYQPTKADLTILKDTDPDYRVYNLNEAFDASSRTSYFHKNIGGYHGAKMRRYQELIDHNLLKERQQIVSALSGNTIAPEEALQKASAFNMLNTRYFIVNANAEPLKNPFTLGNAWFVKDYLIVNNADEEISAIGDFRPDNLAIVDKHFENYLQGFKSFNTSDAVIKLNSYVPNHLVYSYSANSDELAVFSEIYYDKGWNAYIDGKKMPYFRANYVLRAMVVPAGNHKIEFRFEPKSYYAGQMISLISSLLVIFLIIGSLIFYGRQWLQNNYQLKKERD